MEQELISGVRLFAILQLLILGVVLLVVYHGRMSNRVYNQSRYLLAFGTLLVVATFVAQYLGHFRESQPCLSWAINIFCYSIVSPLYCLAEANLLRGGHLPKKTLLLLFAYWILNGLLYLVGYATGTLINNESPLHSLTFVCCLLFAFASIYMCHNLYQEMRRTNQILSCSDDELQRGRLLAYTANSLNFLIFLIIVAPWVAMSSSLLLNALLGIFFAPVVAWFLIAFICYGYRMDEVVDIENAIVEADDQKDDSADYSGSYLEQMVDQWIAQERFADPVVSINKAAHKMKVSTGALNRYINDNWGLSYRAWIAHLRIEHAKKIILQNPNLSNEAVAERCGFSSRTAFQRSFSDHVGMPPKQWRDLQG